ncbi:Uncharacterised protein [Mycobacterium tuberculosis]|nr:Uncharacterised protein [Mycobacterium tuberculosis]
MVHAQVKPCPSGIGRHFLPSSKFPLSKLLPSFPGGPRTHPDGPDGASGRVCTWDRPDVRDGVTVRGAGSGTVPLSR